MAKKKAAKKKATKKKATKKKATEEKGHQEEGREEALKRLYAGKEGAKMPPFFLYTPKPWTIRHPGNHCEHRD